MKTILLSLAIVITTMFAANTVFAAEPIVTRNVVVLQNTTAAQCPASWEGKGGAIISQADSGVGQEQLAGTGVQSCTSCTFDPNAKTCTCGTCYDYQN